MNTKIALVAIAMVVQLGLAIVAFGGFELSFPSRR